MNQVKLISAENYKFVVGGKGINVSLILNDLKQISTAIVVYGGEVGKTILNDLKEKISQQLEFLSMAKVELTLKSLQVVKLQLIYLVQRWMKILLITFLKEIENIPSESIFSYFRKIKRHYFQFDMANTLMKITFKK